jgi:predicted nucleotidyltransferase
MLSTAQPDLKTQIVNACLDIFPETKSILLWGSAVTSDFLPTVNDVDVIIEIAADFSQEVVLAERLKTLVQATSFCRLDPFVYLTEAKDEALEFIAPFGFYKANPFIPYLIQKQHEVIFGESLLLASLQPVSLNEALLGILPNVMGSLKRLRMDADVEGSWERIAQKHKASLFVIIRTVFAFEHGGVGSKKESIRYIEKKYPAFESIAKQLWEQVEPKGVVIPPEEAPTVETVLAFVKEMEETLQMAKRRETAH